MEVVFDPYLIPHTSVLTNKSNIDNQIELDKYENDAVLTRCSILY